MSTMTILSAQSLINGRWATFSVERGTGNIEVILPTGEKLELKYSTFWDESELVRFAYGFCHGYSSAKGLKK